MITAVSGFYVAQSRKQYSVDDDYVQLEPCALIGSAHAALAAQTVHGLPEAGNEWDILLFSVHRLAWHVGEILSYFFQEYLLSNIQRKTSL